MASTIKKEKISQPAKWNFRPKPEKSKSINEIVENFETIKMEDKMKNIKLKRRPIENPKKIPLFENIFESKDTNKEHFTGQTIIEGLSPGPAPAPSAPGPSPASTANPYVSYVQSNLSNVQNNLQSSSFSLSKLNSEISNIFDDIDKIDSGSLMYYANAFAEPTPNLNFNIKLNTVDFKKFGKILKNTITRFAQIISNVFKNLVVHLMLVNKIVQAFILNWNQNQQIIITKIANALTQNTATPNEINIFQDQTQKIMTILLVWFFIYNWYYLVFFLDPSDNIRNTYDTSQLLNYSTILYGLFGPSCEVVRLFNYFVVELPSKLTKYLPKPAIFVMMFIIFLILVLSNFQMVILADFFNSLRWNYGTSILSLFVILVVIGYGCNFYWMQSGIPASLTSKRYFAGGAIAVVVFAVYMMYLMSVNIQLGMIFIFAYLVMNTFFSVLWYEGSNFFDILTAISEDIAYFGADLDAENMCKEPPYFEWKKIPTYIWRFIKKTVNYLSAYMFEIILLFMLLGGINTYMKNFQSTINAKSAMNSLGSTSLSNAFKQLFTWLILINVILIILIAVLMIQKYYGIQSIQVNTNFKSPSTHLGSLTSQSTKNMMGGEGGMGPEGGNMMRPEGGNMLRPEGGNMMRPETTNMLRPETTNIH